MEAKNGTNWSKLAEIRWIIINSIQDFQNTCSFFFSLFVCLFFFKAVQSITIPFTSNLYRGKRSKVLYGSILKHVVSSNGWSRINRHTEVDGKWMKVDGSGRKWTEVAGSRWPWSPEITNASFLAIIKRLRVVFPNQFIHYSLPSFPFDFHPLFAFQ